MEAAPSPTKAKIKYWRIARLILLLPLIVPFVFIAALAGREKPRRWLINFGVFRPKTLDELAAQAVFRVNMSNWTGRMTVFETIYRIVLHKSGVRLMTNFLSDFVNSVTSEIGEAFFLKAAKMDDRSLAIVCTSLLERYMALAIMTRFGISKGKDDYDKAFGPNGPLAGMSSKIAMCSVLNILVGEMLHDLNLLRKVRNKFAHELKDITFTDKDPPIADWCRSLKMGHDLNEEIKAAAGNESRIRFIASTHANMLHLAVLVLRNAHASEVLIRNATEISEKTKEAMTKIIGNTESKKEQSIVVT